MKEKGWAITYGTTGDFVFKGIYIGWHLTRREVISDHVKSMGKNWKYWYRIGHRAVKIEIKTV